MLRSTSSTWVEVVTNYLGLSDELHLQPGPPDAVVLGEVVEGALVHPGTVPEHESRDLSTVHRQDLEEIK